LALPCPFTLLNILYYASKSFSTGLLFAKRDIGLQIGILICKTSFSFANRDSSRANGILVLQLSGLLYVVVCSGFNSFINVTKKLTM